MYLFKQYCGSTVNTVSNSLTFDEMSKVKVSMTLNDFMKFASDLALTPVLLPKATIMTLYRGVIAKQTDQVKAHTCYYSVATLLFSCYTHTHTHTHFHTHFHTHTHRPSRRVVQCLSLCSYGLFGLWWVTSRPPLCSTL
jgi:hypothetical protein